MAGVKYYLTVDMESTECRKTRVSGDHIDLTTCPLAAGGQQEVTALTPSQPCAESEAFSASILTSLSGQAKAWLHLFCLAFV